MRQLARNSLLFSWLTAAGLTPVAFLLAGGPLIAQKENIGAFRFLGLSVLCCGVFAAFQAWSLVVLFLTVELGVLSLWIFQKKEIATAEELIRAFALMVGCLVTILVAWQQLGFDVVDSANYYIMQIFNQLAALQQTPKFDAALLLDQMPSLLAIGCWLLLWTTVATEDFFRRVFNRETSGLKSYGFSRSFRLPAWVMWLSLVAVLLAFSEGPIPDWVGIVALNVFNVLVIWFFFQGLAVAQNFFDFLSLSPLWRVLFYVLFVIQMVLMVAAIGFLDYWFEFRKKMNKRATSWLQ
ncbi:MAG: hypothetical protein COT74_04325 [Bdellovibrionales bacterium CG10_big_fil_rev_8_21_14_0_10_45_34]|nr:MAG: hypothetical protein COT74_04325 [Bdellovibrionales bacterium CG10_big_fil_rev_8_21_14_0_10_45_34]